MMYDINYLSICETIICADLHCSECPLSSDANFQEYLASLVLNNVITHNQLIQIENKERERE